MLNFVIYISMLLRAEGHKYQSVLFSTKHTSVCKQWSESLVRCKTSIGYSHKNIDYIPLSPNINIFTGRILGFVIYIKMSWYELPLIFGVCITMSWTPISQNIDHIPVFKINGQGMCLSCLYFTIFQGPCHPCAEILMVNIPCHAVYHTLLCI